MSSHSLLDRLRGWFPKEPFAAQSKEGGKGKSSITAYAVGYGVGLGSAKVSLSYLILWVGRFRKQP